MSAACPGDSDLIYSRRTKAVGSFSIRREEAPATRVDLIEGLRAQIRQIQGGREFGPVSSVATPSLSPGPAGWTLGLPAVDDLLGFGGLDGGGLHEIRSGALGDGVAAAAATASRRTFALLLAVRRLRALERPGLVLWCLPAAGVHESGAPYSRGLSALGLDPDRILIVSPRRAKDVLWVVEEAVKAGCLSLVLGEVAAIGATEARRLSLAAAEARTPCILVSQAARAPAIATATRWRVAPHPSGDDPVDPAAPGACAFALSLERCRARPLVSGVADFVVEWSHAARCFHMAAAVSHRALAPGFAILGDERPLPLGVRRTA